MLRSYLKIALRNLAKNKVYSVINIGGLSIGMAVAVLISLWVYDELSFNHHHRHYDRLAQLYIHQAFNGTTVTNPAVSIPSVTELKTKYPNDFKAVSLASWEYEHLLVHGETKLNKVGMYADPVLPEMLSLPMLKGGYATALREPASILLSESVAKALFGEVEPMNKLIRLDTKTNVKVTGIFADLPFNSTLQSVKFFLPWSAYGADQPWVKRSEQEWNNHSFQCFVQVAEKANLNAVSAKIRDVEKPHVSPQEKPEYFLHPMEAWHLRSEFKNGLNVGGRIQFVWLFGVIGGVVLLLACINFMNLSTARSEKRAKEVGIRKAVGSLRPQLIVQFLSESMLVVLMALVLALLLLELSLTPFNELAGKQVSVPYGNPGLWLLLLGFTLLAGLLAGSYPALYLSSFNPLSVLKGTGPSSRFRVGRWAAVPRQVLVVVQFTVSITLIIGTLIVFRQIQYAKNRPVNYDRTDLMQIPMAPALFGKYETLRNDLKQTGAVYEMSWSSSPTTGVWASRMDFDWEGKDPKMLSEFGMIGCTHEFGETIGWRVIEGRDFSRAFSTDTAAYVLNEAAVKLTGMKNIIGKTIRFDGKPRQVVGIVKDLVMESPYKPVQPTVFLLDGNWANLVNIKLVPNAPLADAVKKIEAVFKKYNPESPFDFKFADEEYDAKFRAEERVGKLARVFAVLAIFISCLGLFGLASFVAEQRTKEIGVRKVLGASVLSLWGLLSKEFVRLCLLSFALAAPIAYFFLSDWLEKYEYRAGISWWIFVLSGVGSLVIALLTVSFQSVKVALMNPVKSLRSE